MYTTFVPFTDYSQWERRPQKPALPIKPSLSPGKTRSKPVSILQVGSTKKVRHRHNGACLSAKDGSVIVRSRPGLTHEDRRLGSSGVRPMSQRSESAVRLRYLRMQVSSKKCSIEDVRQYMDQLLTMNMSMIRNIQHVEHRTHSDVDDMLEKYSKFKGAISRLKVKSSDQLERARDELHTTRAMLESEISELHRTVSETERVLHRKTQEHQVLLTYKEKDFPLKVVRIEQLKEQCELVKERNEIEIMELKLQIAEESDKCGQQIDCVRKDLETKATEVSLVSMKRSVHEKAIQNRIMEKELILHQKKRNELQEAVSTLKSNIKRLKDSMIKKTESRHQLPIAKLGKCLPNTELMLNIPRQERVLM